MEVEASEGWKKGCQLAEAAAVAWQGLVAAGPEAAAATLQWAGGPAVVAANDLRA